MLSSFSPIVRRCIFYLYLYLRKLKMNSFCCKIVFILDCSSCVSSYAGIRLCTYVPYWMLIHINVYPSIQHITRITRDDTFVREIAKRYSSSKISDAPSHLSKLLIVISIIFTNREREKRIWSGGGGSKENY